MIEILTPPKWLNISLVNSNNEINDQKVYLLNDKRN